VERAFGSNACQTVNPYDPETRSSWASGTSGRSRRRRRIHKLAKVFLIDEELKIGRLEFRDSSCHLRVKTDAMFRRALRPALRPININTNIPLSLRARLHHASSVAEQTEPLAPEVNQQRRPFEHVPWKEPAATKGTVRFFGGTTDNKPHTLNFKKGEELQSNIGKSEELQVTITDLRNYEPPTSLSFEGLEWIHHPSVITEEKLLNPAKEEVDAFVRGPYFDECAALVKQKSGAAKAIAYNYRHRRIEVVGAPLPPCRRSLTD
jgi:hypothetical protein